MITICKWMGWSWPDLLLTPSEVIPIIVEMINESNDDVSDR